MIPSDQISFLNGRDRLRGGILAALLIAIAGVMYLLGFGQPTTTELSLKPWPDATDQVWVALALSEGLSPLLPIGHELHPSRYAPIHSFFLAACINVADGDWRGALFWPPFALFAGLCLLAFGLRQFSVSRTACVVCSALIGTSVLVLKTSQSLLQESTLFFLVSADVALAGRYARRQRGWLLGVSGLIGGALICIRPTFALWPVARLLYAWWTSQLSAPTGKLKETLRAFWPYLLGCAALMILEMVAVHHQSGLWSIHAYSYWQDTSSFFGWNNSGLKQVWSRKYSDLGPRQLVWMALIGLHRDVSALGWLANALVFAGLPLGIWLLIKRKSFVLVLVVFGLLQAAVHCFYFFYEPRHLIAAYPWLVIGGIVGWDVFLGSLIAGKRLWLRQAVRLIPALAIAAAAFHPWEIGKVTGAYHRLQMSARKGSASTLLVDSRECGKTIRGQSGSLFVDGMDTVAARILLELGKWPHPIYQLTGHENWWSAPFEGHFAQLTYARNRTTRFVPPSDRRRPFEIYLVRDGAPDLERLKEALAEDDVMICIPIWRDKQCAHALAEIAREYEIHPVGLPQGNLRLLKVSRSGGK